MAKRVGWLAVLVLVPGLFAYARHRRLSNEVVDRVLAASVPRARIVHREPALESTFEAELAPLLDAPPAWGVYGPGTSLEVMHDVGEVVAGRRSLDTLALAFEQDAESTRPWVERLMACSRAKANGEVEGQGLLADRRHPRMQVSWYLPLEWWGPLEVRRVLSRGDRAGALRWCVDLQANARDATVSRPEFGLEFALLVGKRLAAPCEDALRTASVEERKRFHEELSRLRAGVPTFRELLERRRAHHSLHWWGAFLLAGDLARLPESARPSAGEALRGEWPRRQVGLYFAWADLEASRQEFINAADAADRDARFDTELRRSRPFMWATGESWTPSPLDEAHEYDEWISQLDRLARASKESP